jgi:2-polyprenyl-6-methoxyphenol hydroxylase-like FAD-dependent oxidoreductase
MLESKIALDQIPVLIAGGGPVGLGLAAELGGRGIDCMVVEQGDGAFSHPRANIVHARTMELCRRWGVADRVRQEGVAEDYPHTVTYVTSMAGWELARHDPIARIDGNRPNFSPEQQQRCNQMFFDPIMRDLARSIPEVDLRFGQRLESFEQIDDGVVANINDLDARESIKIRARYLVDCTGGTSRIRDNLGIELEGTPVLGHSINVFFSAPEFRRIHDKGDAGMYMITGPDGIWANIAAINGNDFWRLTIQGLTAETDPATFDVAHYMNRVVGMDFDYEIRSVVKWTRRTVVAERFRDGNVFLAGDSGHQLSPSGAFGMNTGMGDVDNLGWKLAAMLEGWGGDDLLDSYEAERRPVAVRNVTEAEGAFRGRNFKTDAALLEDTPEGATLRAEISERIARENTASFVPDGVVFGYSYDRSPVVISDGGQAPETSLTLYNPTSFPGARAPHAALEDGSSILDLFGSGFVLLLLGSAPPSPDLFLEAAQSRGVPFKAVRLAEPEIYALYDRFLVLVRPDGHVAWRGNELPEDIPAVIDRVRGV